MRIETCNLNLPTIQWRFYTIATHATPGTVLSLSRVLTISAIVTTANGDNPSLTVTAHKFQVGDVVLVAGTNNSNYNGPLRVTSVTDANHFKVNVLGAQGMGAPTLSSATVTQRVMAQLAILLPDSGNVADVSIGPDSGADMDAIGLAAPTPPYWELKAPHGAKFDLADWYIKSASASQTVKVLFV